MKKIKSCFTYLAWLIYYYAAYVIGIFVRRFPYFRNMWLISERRTEARDNGFHFFKYLSEKRPEINAAFIIDKNSPDYARVAALGKTIQPNTLCHMLAFACAKIRISTHYMSCSPDDYRFSVLRRIGLIRGKNAVIRHGITCNDLKELHYSNAKPDLLVCSSLPEYENMKNTYGHPDGVVRRLGLCRYDRLLSEHTVKKQILVMPTWRYFLHSLSDAEFVKSDYYKCFSSLINNGSLIKALEKNGYTLVFYLHYVLQPYSHLFKSSSSRVKILKKENSDVQQLLMESAVLLTDYSSVFFDFAYMSKPVVYLQFDEQRFYETQYGRGYFNCRTDGFGPVFGNESDAADRLCKIIEQDAHNDELYSERAEEFFGDRTSDHCEQTFNAIRELLKND